MRTKEEIVAFRLLKSASDLEAVRSLIAFRHWDVAMNRLYYAAFHAVSALLRQHDIKAKAHAGAKAMLDLHFVKTGKLAVNWGKFYAQLFDERNDSDYEDFAVFSANDVLPLLPQTEEFIALIKELITKAA